MNYTAPPPLRVAEGDPVGSQRGQLCRLDHATLADMTELRSVFACKLSLVLLRTFEAYNQNDVLGFVDNAHLALSDFKEKGPFDPMCLELSEIHSVSLLHRRATALTR